MKMPGQPEVIATTSSIIRVKWKKPNTDKEIDHFELRYRRDNEKGRKLDTKDATTEAVISELQSDSTYYLKVRTIFCDEEESQFSTESSGIKTNISLAKRMKTTSTKLASEYPHVYKLPLSEIHASDLGRKCTLLTEHRDMAKKEKTVMLVGATGAGKSTLIDGMVNYVLGVTWKDDARFTIIDLKPEEKYRDQTQSQTEWITCYTLNWMPGCQIDFHLNIVDTPGFGDTRGIKRDKELVDQIKRFFACPGDQGIDTLDAVCFVAQAPLGRLTITQQYIFDSILSVFGKDISSNIFGLITFADGNEPPVLDAMKEAKVPFESHFVFNNSALFVNPDNSEFGSLFWEMGRKSFERFFGCLDKVVTKSLKLTRDVLATREQIRFDISQLQDQIAQGMQEQATMQEETRILEMHSREIEDNKNFEYQVEIAKTVVIHTTFCPLCSRTCHDDCYFDTDAGKASCGAMDGENCAYCPPKCHWSVHRNVPFNRSAGKEMVTKTLEETKKQYLTAKEQKEKSVSLLDKIMMKFKQLREENKKLVKRVRGLINNLRNIAIKHNPLSEIEYIEMMIEQEYNGLTDGYKERIKMYEDLKKEAMAMQDIAENKEFFPDDEPAK